MRPYVACSGLLERSAALRVTREHLFPDLRKTENRLNMAILVKF